MVCPPHDFVGSSDLNFSTFCSCRRVLLFLSGRLYLSTLSGLLSYIFVFFFNFKYKLRNFGSSSMS